MNQKEEARLKVLNEVLERRLTVNEASELMGLSERHGWRLLEEYRKDGAAALAHGNRGRQPSHSVPEETRTRVRELAQGCYLGCNHCHLTELLAERESIVLSRSTVRRILVEAGLKSPRQRRLPKHRCRRERYAQEGMLLQIDASRHLWLGERGPYLDLVGAIDDATGTVPFALFREQEDAQGYFLLLREVIRHKGIPLALYSDRHSIFQRSPKEPETVAEQLEGERQPTQFGRALEELGIQAIFAQSPQAKGRIERLWGTLQDRLVTELRLAGASTLQEANRTLSDFLPRFNVQFGVPPAQAGSAYRLSAPGLCLDSVLCFKYLGKVAKDNTVHFGGHILQLLPALDRASYAHARVQIQERLDGSLVVAYRDQVVATREAPPDPVTLRARKTRRAPATTASDSLVVGVSPAAAPGSCGVGLGPDHEDARPQAGKLHASRPSPDHPWRKASLT